MKIVKIFQDKTGREIIFQLENGIKVIKRSEDKVKKLNVSKWEEVNFIPESFQLINREITRKEKKHIKNVLEENDDKKSIWKRLKINIKNLLK